MVREINNFLITIFQPTSLFTLFSRANGDMKHDASDDESEEDNVEGDYTVYECPGLAPVRDEVSTSWI